MGIQLHGRSCKIAAIAVLGLDLKIDFGICIHRNGRRPGTKCDSLGGYKHVLFIDLNVHCARWDVAERMVTIVRFPVEFGPSAIVNNDCIRRKCGSRVVV